MAIFIRLPTLATLLVLALAAGPASVWAEVAVGRLEIRNGSSVALCVSIAHAEERDRTVGCPPTGGECRMPVLLGAGRTGVLEVPAGRMSVLLGQRARESRWSLPVYVAPGQHYRVDLDDENVPGAVGGVVRCE